MNAPHVNRDGGFGPMSEAQWAVPPRRESLIERSPWENVWFRVLAVSLVVAGVVAYRIDPASIDSMAYFVSFAKSWMVILLGHVGAILLYTYRRDSVPYDRTLEHWLAEFSQNDACPVQITVRKSGVALGSDAGLLWLHEGCLRFRGGSTSFSLPRAALTPWAMWTKSERLRARERDDSRLIPLVGVQGDREIHIAVIDRSKDYSSMRRAVLLFSRIDSWLRSSFPGEPIGVRLPPSVPHPLLRSSNDILKETLLAAGILCLTDIALVTIPGPHYLDHNLAVWDAVSRVGGAVCFLGVCLLVFQTIKTLHIRSQASPDSK